ncbi:MAG: hypothetical protein EBY29_17645, partial [Planctomycetes bacterium]|nr:hypothetical protein [Planctomycetota bacterium]
GSNTVTKSLTGTGIAQGVVLSAGDVSTLGNGTISVSASATDAAGNTSTLGSSSFTLDTVAPTVTISAVGGVDSVVSSVTGDAIVTGTAEANSTVSITQTVGGALLGTTTTNASGNYSYTLTAANITTLGQGADSITVTQTDAAGNTGSSAAFAISVDTVAPTVTAVTDSTSASVTNQPITFTATFGEAVVGTVGTGNFTATNGVVSSVTMIDSTHYTVVVTPNANVAAGNTVALSLVGGTLTDAAGNAITNANLSSLDSQGVDTAAPTAPVFALGTGVSGGATSAEAIQGTGVVTVNAESGAAISVTFTNGSNTVTKSLTGTGIAQGVVLSAGDVSTLGNGTI